MSNESTNLAGDCTGSRSEATLYLADGWSVEIDMEEQSILIVVPGYGAHEFDLSDVQVQIITDLRVT